VCCAGGRARGYQSPQRPAAEIHHLCRLARRHRIMSCALFRVCVCSSLSLSLACTLSHAWKKFVLLHFGGARSGIIMQMRMVPCNTSNNIFWAKLLRKVRVTRASIYSRRGKSFCIANFGNDMFLRLFSRDKVQQLVESAFPSGWVESEFPFAISLGSRLELCGQANFVPLFSYNFQSANLPKVLDENENRFKYWVP
jgi:hypothetical protein